MKRTMLLLGAAGILVAGAEIDPATFAAPPKTYRPETWFHFINGNVTKPGITADLRGIAVVKLNGRSTGTVWTRPNELPLKGLKAGANTLAITVTSPWHNRLVYDQSLSEKDRKTWTYGAPAKDTPFRPFGFTLAEILTKGEQQ